MGYRRAYERDTLPRLQRLFNYRTAYVYDVPGDGFCGLHAVLALFREIRYLENLAYF